MIFAFEVEQIATIAYGMPVVLARLLTRESALPATMDDWTLGGCRVAQCLEIPAGLRADGTPRLDLFAFELQFEEDLERFVPGLRVTLQEER